MALTLAEMQTIIGEATGSDSTATMTRYLNKAQEKLALESEKLKRTTLAANGEGYVAIPADCYVLKAVYYEGYALRKYMNDDIPEYTKGTPVYYLKDEITIGETLTEIVRIYPSPDSGDNVQMAYIKKPVSMVNTTDTPELSDCEDYLIAYANWKILADTDDVSSDALKWKSVAEEEKADWLKLNKDQNARPHRIRVSSFR